MFKQNVDIEEIEKINNLSEAQYMLTEIADKIHERGKLEGKLEDAKKMKEEGDSIEKIARITGLTVEEIEKL